jgi:hypothetical protein
LINEINQLLKFINLFVVEKYFYSYLKVSAGFNFDACFAGINPDKDPIKKANSKHPKIKYQGNETLNKFVPN